VVGVQTTAATLRALSVLLVIEALLRTFLIHGAIVLPDREEISMADAIGVVSDAVTVLAVLAALCWFWMQRQVYPRTEVGLRIESLPIAGTWKLLRVTVCIKNVGNVLLRVENMKVKVSAVNPPGPVDVLVQQTGDLLDPGRVPTVWKAPWPVLHERVAPFGHDFEIEPNDTDDIAFDFPIACEVRAVSVYVHIRNSSKKRDGRSLGWERNALFDLTGQPSSLYAPLA